MPGKYMVDYAARKIPPPYGPLDEQGIPLFEPRYVRASGTPVYHPIVIIQYALAHHQLAVDGNLESREIFVRCARWIEEHIETEPNGKFGVWYYRFPLRTPPVTPPWISGMAQGQALSLLARLYEYIPSDNTAQVARSAARAFLFSVTEGGIVSTTPQGGRFIEEAAHPPSIHILNGCLYALFGLFEYLQIFKDAELQPVFTQCQQGIEEVLPLYDLGWWSRYSLGLRWNMATPYYHQVHIHQLRYLGELFNRPKFLEVAEHWERCSSSRLHQTRRNLLGLWEVNVNRALTLTHLNSIKYRRVENWED